MLKFLIRIQLILCFLIVGSSVFGQVNDTISLEFKELLILGDTIYYGTDDSIVVLDKKADYQILTNRFLRNEDYYEKHPEKEQEVEKSQNKFKELIMEQIQDTKVHIPKGFNPSDEYFENFEGKIIKDIYYNQVGVLDGSVFDTTKTSTTTFGRFLNSAYTSTKLRTLENNIRFEENEAINYRILSDNERILRNLPYIEEAKIYIVPISNESDSVNILVVTKDKYPIGISVDVRDYNYFLLEPYTRNFMGLGHRIGAPFQYKGDVDPKIGYGLNYEIDNIQGTFTKAELGYFNSYDTEYFRSRLEKAFVSTDTKFGGEIAYENLATDRTTTHYTPDSVYDTEDYFHSNIYDVWLGYSIFFSRDITKPFLNVAGRYYHESYEERPYIDPETNYSFHSNNTILGALTYQQVSFFETTKLLNYGVVEYVPVGLSFSITGGWQRTSFYDRPYAGVGANYSVLSNKTGIFSVFTDVGGYYRNSKFEDLATLVRFLYFSPLLPVKSFELRNVFALTLNNTINPLYTDKVTFGKGVRGIENSEVYGNGTIVMRYQPIFYTPYEVLGFNFSFKPFVDIGWISDSNLFGGSKQFYSVIGIGASVKNESLIFPAMNLYVGYYPNETGDGDKFGFKVVFKDYELINFFSDLKPKTASPADFYY